MAHPDERSKRAFDGPNLFAIYYRDISQLPLLSPSQERELARRLHRGRGMILKALSRSPIVIEKIIEIGRRLASGDEALSKVIRTYDERRLAPCAPAHQTADRRKLERCALAKFAAIERLYRKERKLLCRPPGDGNSLRDIARLHVRLSRLVRELDLNASARETFIELVRKSAREPEACHACPFPSASPWATFRRIKQGRKMIEAAKEELVLGNLRLVISIAKRYMVASSGNQALEPMDLVQEGNLGLMRALDDFDHRLGYKLSTYATWWIHQAIRRAIRKYGRLIRLPEYIIDRNAKISRVANSLWHALGRDPTCEEIAASSGLSDREVMEAFLQSNLELSLEPRSADDESYRLAASIADERAASPEELLEQQELKTKVEKLLSFLPEREAYILRMRFGINEAQNEHTLQEIGQRLSLSRERVRQLEARAMAHLRAIAASVL